MEITQDDLRQARKLAGEAMDRRERRFMQKYGRATNDALLAYLRQLARELGFTPDANDVVCVQFLKNRLGDWNSILEQAGLSPSSVQERDGLPTAFEREVQRQLYYHQQAVRQLEEQEENFVSQHFDDSDEEILAYLQECAKRIKRAPTICEVIGGEYIKERFGGWGQALSLAGLSQAPANPPKRWHRQIYLDELRRQREIGMETRREAKKVIYVPPNSAER